MENNEKSTIENVDHIAMWVGLTGSAAAGLATVVRYIIKIIKKDS